MTDPRISPYGTWHSPLTADLIAAASLSLSEPRIGDDALYWLERRPLEKGRTVIVRRRADGLIEDVIPQGFSARTRANEYGGGVYACQDGMLYFCNEADQRIYRHALGDATVAPVPLAPAGPYRYADLTVDRARGRLIAVREDHGPDPHEPENTLVAIGWDGGVQVLAAGNDFYSSPRVSPDGRHLAWLTWNHPHMPWDATALWLAALADDGRLTDPVQVAGGPGESIFQPEWSPAGELYFVADRSGWWNLYRWTGSAGVCVHPMAAEFGLPQWVFGMSTYGFVDAQRIACAYTRNGAWTLALLDATHGTRQDLALPYTTFSGVHARHGSVLTVAAGPTVAASVVQIDPAHGATRVLRESSAVAIAPAYLSIPEAMTVPRDGGEDAHGLLYPPMNAAHRAPAGERPPLLVRMHGGPTAAAQTGLDLGVQFWTSRGFAFLDVNYAGSTGYGRTYRERLYGQWGERDLDDCVNGVVHLVQRGRVDPARVAIRGSSAGGFTALAALTFRRVFKAGASYYGISDLEALARDTHKFESRYTDRLVGASPTRRERYRQRSPIHHLDRLAAPLICFQGLDDEVVPPNQAEALVDAVRRRGLPVAYLAFEGEAHGFRRAATIKRALEAELYFYGRVFGFIPADPIEPVTIENLPVAVPPPSQR